MNGRTSRRRMRGSAAVAAFLVAVAGAGCAAESDTPDTQVTSGDVSAAVDFYAAYTGSTPGKAEGDPITIGYVNMEGGDLGFPEVTASAEVAVELVNEELGGIGGRPLELRTCMVVSSEEQGQACAQKFINDDDIDLVIEGVIPVGGAAFHQTMAGGKPVLIANPSSVDDASARNSYALSAGSFTSQASVDFIVDTLGAKSVGMLNKNDDPVSIQKGKTVRSLLEQAGVKVTEASFNGTTTDFTAPIAATGGNDNDVIFVLAVSPPACIGAATAVDKLGITADVVSLFPCVSQPVKDGLGDFPKWNYIFTSEVTTLPQESPAVEGYLAAMASAGNKTYDGLAPLGFAAVMMAVKALNEAGEDAGGDKIASVLAAMSTGAPMFPDKLEFGSFAGSPAMGTTGAKAYTYEGDGKWVDANGGAWIYPEGGVS